MNPIAAFVPLLTMLILVPAIFGGTIRLSAHLLRYRRVSWKQGFVFGFAMTMFSLFVRKAIFFLGYSIPVAFGTILGLVVTLASGSWFFSSRADDANGQALGWRGGILLTAVAFVLFAVTGLILVGAFRVLLVS